MSLPVPETEPTSLRAGDFLTWLKDLSDNFPADDGWALTYTLIHPTLPKITISTTASGKKFLVSVAATTTANYAAGVYQWMARVVKTTEIHTVDVGTIEILPNLAAATTFDFRSHARIMLEAIEAAYENRASVAQLEYEIQGRRLRTMDAPSLIKWRDYYLAEVAAEEAAEQLANSGINPRRIGIRMVRI